MQLGLFRSELIASGRSTDPEPRACLRHRSQQPNANIQPVGCVFVVGGLTVRRLATWRQFAPRGQRDSPRPAAHRWVCFVMALDRAGEGRGRRRRRPAGRRAGRRSGLDAGGGLVVGLLAHLGVAGDVLREQAVAAVGFSKRDEDALAGRATGDFLAEDIQAVAGGGGGGKCLGVAPRRSDISAGSVTRSICLRTRICCGPAGGSSPAAALGLPWRARSFSTPSTARTWWSSRGCEASATWMRRSAWIASSRA